jgi:hypothetical protein
MAQIYSFPILEDAELLACVREMDLPLSAATLAKPTPEIVKPVYENVIATLMGITRCAFLPNSQTSRSWKQAYNSHTI